MRRIFHLSVKLIVNGWEIDKSFGLMHQNVMTKMKTSVSEDWTVKIIVEYGINILEC